MRTYVEGWVRVRVCDEGEAPAGQEDALDWVRAWPRRRLATGQLWGGDPVLCVAEWPVGREVGALDDGGAVGVGLFRPTRLACRVCGRDLVALRADAGGWGVFDRWRDGIHDLLKACPACGAGRQAAGLTRVLAGGDTPDGRLRLVG